MTATIHKVVAGNGYEYYLRKVAANDTDSRGRSSLADYYSAVGESPGHWHGTGLAALDLTAGAEVTEDQMKSLFGLGRHPNATAMEAAVYDEQIRLGAKHKDAVRAADKATRLGNPFRVYSENSAFRKRCAKAFQEYNSEHGLDPHEAIPESENIRIRTHVAFDMFTDEYGRAPLHARELSGWVAKASRPKTAAVAGFDITFSPVKSVSVLWALTPKAVSEKVEDAHRRAITDALTWLERHAVGTRLGRNGIRHVDVDGIVAAWFDHRDSRAGDPDLHTHVLIANRVRTLDGRWRTLYGADIYRALVTVSEIYNTRLEHHLEHLVGVQFATRPDTAADKRPIREIIGIPVQVIHSWSRRDADITRRLEELSAMFQRELGREPTPGEVYDLAERATLETRPTKHLRRSLAEQRRTWRAQAVQILGSREAVAEIVTVALHPLRTPRISATTEWISRTADRVLEVVSAQRSTWRNTNIRAETERQLRGRIEPEEWEWAAEAVAAEALSPARSVQRGDPDTADEPELASVPVAFQRRDGRSVYADSAHRLYTSAAVLSVEQQLIGLAVQPGGRQLAPDHIATAVREFNTAHPDRPLNAGQAAVIEGFATSGLRVHAANAPAGSGKTTAMRVLTTAWHNNNGTVLGLAPTASAAAELGEAIGARVETVDKVLHVLNQHQPGVDNAVRAAERPPVLPQWILDIDAGTLVIVDEHVKVGNLKRLRLLQFLSDRGATIRCIGDDRQLPAIEAGGADIDMHNAAPENTLTLTHVVRFASAGEATGSVQLRDGDPSALAWYLDHGRIHGGHTGSTHDDAYTAWIDDHLNGRDTIMLAATHDTVTALNARARVDRLTRDGSETGAEVALTDELRASVGDTIRTRRNDSTLRLGTRDWVRNGYTWTVTAVHDDGSITAQHLRSGTQLGDSVRLPADYVAENVRLGYAATIDSAQGITTDTCHIALTGGETRQQFYVAMTRGRHANHAYVPTALDGSEGSFWTEPAIYPRTAVEVLLHILDHDGAQKSAHTALRDALDPHRRIGRALDIYLDQVGLAAEDALGADELQRLDDTAEMVRAHLTDSPAYPVLRQHLALIALSGHDPIDALTTAAAERELDTAIDPAAVLDWRLDPTGAHSLPAGPLPWAHGLPAGLDNHPLATQLRARERIVADLADQIRTTTQTWTPATAPHWARPLIGINQDLIADLAVWRASLHIKDREPHPTGPRRYSNIEREHQETLDARLTACLGDRHLPTNLWSPLAHELEPRITRDPYWPVIADKIDVAHRAGIDITTLLTDAAATRPLPDEMPAAALWSRLELEPSALDNTLTAGHLRPGWLSDLHAVLGHYTADRVTEDPAWPRLVASVDRATGTAWSARDLLATAYELLTSAQPDEAPGLRPDQLAAALAWRIDALLRHLPTLTTPPHTTETQPEPTSSTASTSPEHDQEPRMKPEPQPHPASTSATDPANRTHTSALPDTITAVAQMFAAGRVEDATAAFQRLSRSATADQKWIIAAVADTLYRNAYPVARARLEWAATRYPDQAALIRACTPTADPRTYQPDTDSRPSTFRRDRAARDHEPATPRQRSEPLPADEQAGRDLVQNYLDNRDDSPFELPDRTALADPPARVPTRDTLHPRSHRRDEAPDPTPDAYVLDFDLAAVPDTRRFGCVSCGIERAPAETLPTPPRRSDDGLCEDCRDTGHPGIPDHDPADHIHTRCTYITENHTPVAARAMLRRDWYGSFVHRAAIEDWVAAHPFPEPDTNPSAQPAPDNPLLVLSDAQLDQHIDQLELRLALVDTETAMYHPGDQPTDELDTEITNRIDDIQHELTAYRGEQERRSALTPEQHRYERSIRAVTNVEDAEPESFAEPSFYEPDLDPCL
ncbi:MobF family relaxase [Nocardia fusca]|uniref:MobF family relaxase n=1 Tax=Nocardia fusca TaxID=941183 RepID=UPI0007A73C04|nr:MobF family relaxase [Nocardia fusca]